MRNANKLKRHSFKTKVILIGASILMSVALAATGFAAWVISTDVTAETGVGVAVGAVENANMEVTITNSTEGKLDQTLKFEPVKGDGGRVRWDGSEENSENLTLIIEGTVSNATYLGSIQIKIEYGETLLKSAAEAGYITLPEENEEGYIIINAVPAGTQSIDGVENGYLVSGEGSTAVAHFRATVKFGWGSKFAGVNPCFYYDGVNANGGDLDNKEDILAKTASEVEAELNKLYAALYKADASVQIKVMALSN